MGECQSTAKRQERAIAALLHYGTGLASFVIAAGLVVVGLLLKSRSVEQSTRAS